jgi:3-oxo-5alpha-steroid 4-dehydrogenase
VIDVSEEPLRIAGADALDWHDSGDVVVVGFGAAGACAALAAREAGAEVILVDRFDGGGASALSGGVYYGGATRYQREAGFSDTPEEMYRYLKLEVTDAVSDATLRRFCEQSAANLEWLVSHGAQFSGRLSPDAEAYMTPGYFLYYSGNERVPSYAAAARPAPRGHIAVGEGGGSMGQYLFAALRRATLAAVTRFYSHSPAVRLVLDRDGAVLGVEVSQLPAGSIARAAHRLSNRLFNLGKGILYGAPARVLMAAMARAERHGVRRLIRARRGVVLATGGFMHNREMVARHLPMHRHAIPLGSAGCTGDGIRLGEAAGARTSHMNSIDTSRSLILPKPFARGVLVDGAGRRFIAEDAYGATIGHRIAFEHGGRAWLLLDAALYREAWKTVMPWKQLILRYRVRSLMPLVFAWRRARTLDELARKCGLPAQALAASVADYNRGAATKQDALGKLAVNLRALASGPYYAVDVSTDSRGFPPTSFTLGGLVVDEASGQVIRQDGQHIAGLYAAGRNAVGIPSNFYVSGLAIADCVFSGRRAGGAAAMVLDDSAAALPERRAAASA